MATNNNNKDNFLEIESKEEANKVNLNEYTFIRFSEQRNCYIFKIKQR